MVLRWWAFCAERTRHRSCAAPFRRFDMTKQEMRAAVKAKRAQIPPEEKERRDRAIVQQIAASGVFASASSLLIYAPQKGEINLLPLIKLARQKGIPVGFPRCDTQSTPSRFTR